MQHDLKTDPKTFQDTWEGKKTFEIRLNDRGYDRGDTLILRETKHSGAEMKKGQPLIFTGRCCGADVKHILVGPTYGLEKGWVIMSHLPVVRWTESPR